MSSPNKEGAVVVDSLSIAFVTSVWSDAALALSSEGVRSVSCSGSGPTSGSANETTGPWGLLVTKFNSSDVPRVGVATTFIF